jgi:glycosyltransferase involved in cell wall biosynthesis
MISAMATPAPIVGLWAHRWGDLASRTGVGRYARSLAEALADLDGPHAYERRGGQEAGPATGRPVLRRSWPPRRALHASWLATGRPRLERVAPPTDLLHVLFPSFPVPTRAPQVGTIHDLFVLDHPGWFGRGEHRAVTASTRRLAAEAERIVAVSDHVAAQLVDRLDVERDRIVVIGHGVDVARGTTGSVPAALDGRAYVVAVGAGTDRKHLSVVLDALNRVEGLELALIGPPGAATAALTRRVADLGIDGRVHQLGLVADDVLAAVLRGAVALVHPSLDEGFGLPPLEAMAAGTPAVVSRSGALPEVVGDAAVIVDPHDPDGWAAELDSLRTDPERRSRLVAAGLAHVAPRTWAAAATATAAVHAAVLREHGRG